MHYKASMQYQLCYQSINKCYCQYFKYSKYKDWLFKVIITNKVNQVLNQSRNQQIKQLLKKI